MGFSIQPESLSFEGRWPVLLAVLADTHVPDRFETLHPDLIPALSEQQPDLILHAGDICAPSVLKALEQVAPVIAVRGNRDWAFAGILPWIRVLEIAGTAIALMHGHGTWATYFLDKWHYLLKGYRFERYQGRAMRFVPDARVFIFGHTHRPVIEWRDGRLFFNPGSASLGVQPDGAPSFGLLQIQDDGEIAAELVPLPLRARSGRRWSV